jgi:hypothetical protein
VPGESIDVVDAVEEGSCDCAGGGAADGGSAMVVPEVAATSSVDDAPRGLRFGGIPGE